jgi:hypothetical protein
MATNSRNGPAKSRRATQTIFVVDADLVDGPAGLRPVAARPGQLGRRGPGTGRRRYARRYPAPHGGCCRARSPLATADEQRRLYVWVTGLGLLIRIASATSLRSLFS